MTTITATLTDDDTGGLILSSPIVSTLAEDGGTETYIVALSSEPTSDVTVDAVLTGAADISAINSPLTFASGDWSDGITFTVSSTDDISDFGGLFNGVTVAFDLTSSDSIYDGLSVDGGIVYATEDEAPPAEFTLSGSFDASVTEADVVSSGFSLTLSNIPRLDFHADVGTPGAETDAILAGIASLNATLDHGWDNEVADDFSLASVTRVSDDEVRIDVAPVPNYVIWGGDEVLHVRVAGTALVPTSGDIDIDVFVRIVDLDATFSVPRPFATEQHVVTGSAVLDVSVTNDRFVASQPDDDDVSTLRGLTSNAALSDGIGNAIAAVDDASLLGDVVFLDDKHVQIVLPALDSYHVTTDEDVDLSVTTLLASGIRAEAQNVTSISDSNEIFVIGGNAATVSEDGSTDSFAIRLTYAPAAGVTVTFAPVDASAIGVFPSVLTFSTANWQAGQTVTVSAIDDELGEGETTTQLGHTLSSSDNDLVVRPPFDVTVRDDDFGFVVAYTASTVAEGDAASTASFSVRLASTPIDAVTLSLTPDAQLTLSPAGPLIFSTADASIVQTVEMRAVDDTDGEGVLDSTVSFAFDTTDSIYVQAVAPEAIVVTIEDNDVGAATVLLNAVVDEGSTGSLSVSLVGSPSQLVTVSIAEDDSSVSQVAFVSPSDLIFSTDNWMTPGTIVFRARDDNVPEWPGTVVLTTSLASNDTRFDAFPGEDVTVTLIDPLGSLLVDVGIVETVVDGDNVTSTQTTFLNSSIADTPVVLEGSGASTAYAVRMTAAPLSAVVVSVGSDSPDTVLFSVESLTFSGADFNVTQIVYVTPIDDAIPENDVDATLVFDADVSADPRYAASMDEHSLLASLPFLVVDDDILELGDIFFSTLPQRNVTRESGEDSLTFVVMFSSVPTFSEPVGLSATISNHDAYTQASVTPASLVWTSDEWPAGAVFVVDSIDNSVAEGTSNYTLNVCLHNLGTDQRFLNPSSCLAVRLTDEDDDRPSLDASGDDVNGSTSEDGSTVTFSFRLGSQPESSVTVGVASSDVSECSIIGSETFVFAPDAWNTPQTVTVVGEDDEDIDGIQVAEMLVSVTGSADAAYRNLDAAVVEVFNRDDDTVGVQFSLPFGTPSESGSISQVKVALSDQPDTDEPITVTATSSNTNEVTVSPTSFQFTTNNWAVLQGFALAGVDDDIDDGDVAVTVVLRNEATGEENAVVVTNIDDDSAGLSVALRGGGACQLQELPTSVLFDVRLDSQPLASVTVEVRTNDTSEVNVSPRQLVFAPLQWSTAQAIEVVSLLDGISDGDVPLAITFVGSTDGDALYSGAQTAAGCVNENVQWPVIRELEPGTASIKASTVITARGSEFFAASAVGPFVAVNGFQVPVLSVGEDGKSFSFLLPFINSTLGADDNNGDSVSGEPRGKRWRANDRSDSVDFTVAYGTSQVYATTEGYVELQVLNPDGGELVTSDLLYVATNCFLEGEVEDPDSGRCIPCPDGLYCPGGRRAWPLPGWYNLNEFDLEPVRCSPPTACEGGRTSACASGYQDAYCANCESGYFQEGVECRECGGQEGVLIALVSSLFTILLLVGGFLMAALLCRDETFTDIIDVVAAVQMVQNAGRMSRGGTPIFILTFYRYLSVVTLDVEFLQPGCSLGSSFSVVFFGSLILALFVAIPTVLIVLGVGRVRASITARKEGLDAAAAVRRWYFNRTIRVLVLIPILLYISLSYRAMQAVYCVSSGDDRSVLAADPTMECYSSDHMVVAIVAWLILGVITLGLPVSAAVFLFGNRRRLLSNVDLRARFGYMFEETKGHMFWFFLCTIAVELTLIICTVVLESRPHVQFGFGSAVLVTYMSIVVILRPFRKHLENVMAFGSAFVGLIGMSLNYALALEADISNATLLSVSLIVFVLVIVILIAAIMLVFNAVALQRIRVAMASANFGSKTGKIPFWVRILQICCRPLNSGDGTSFANWKDNKDLPTSFEHFAVYWRKVELISEANRLRAFDDDEDEDGDDDEDAVTMESDGEAFTLTGAGLDKYRSALTPSTGANRAPTVASRARSARSRRTRKLIDAVESKYGDDMTLDELAFAYGAGDEDSSVSDDLEQFLAMHTASVEGSRHGGSSNGDRLSDADGSGVRSAASIGASDSAMSKSGSTNRRRRRRAMSTASFATAHTAADVGLTFNTPVVSRRWTTDDEFGLAQDDDDVDGSSVDELNDSNQVIDRLIGELTELEGDQADSDTADPSVDLNARPQSLRVETVPVAQQVVWSDKKSPAATDAYGAPAPQRKRTQGASRAEVYARTMELRQQQPGTSMRPAVKSRSFSGDAAMFDDASETAAKEHAALLKSVLTPPSTRLRKGIPRGQSTSDVLALQRAEEQSVIEPSEVAYTVNIIDVDHRGPTQPLPRHIQHDPMPLAGVSRAWDTPSMSRALSASSSTSDVPGTVNLEDADVTDI